MKKNARVTNYYVTIHLPDESGGVKHLQFEGEYFDMIVTAGACKSCFHCPYTSHTEIETEDGETILLNGFFGNMTDHPMWRLTCVHCGQVNWYDRPICADDVYLCESCTAMLGPSQNLSDRLLN